MGNVGRYFCVALPFLMTLASLAAMLVALLAGVTDKNLYVFQVNTTGFTISGQDVVSLLTTRSPMPATTVQFHDPTLLGASTSDSSSSSSSSSSGNVTAADLDLPKIFNVGLWGYCYTSQNGTYTCTKPAYNWAVNALNSTANAAQTYIVIAGKNVTLPSAVHDAITAYDSLSRWTEIVWIIALVALVVELFFGIFANCSRVFSCITSIIASVATTLVVAAAALATTMAVLVVGGIEASAKWYGVEASFNTTFLAIEWIGAAFAIGAGFFWLFTCCCCAPDHHRSRRSSRNRDRDSGNPDHEKLIPAGVYVNINENSGYQPQYSSGAGAPQARRDHAYEPYSHANV